MNQATFKNISTFETDISLILCTFSIFSRMENVHKIYEDP